MLSSTVRESMIRNEKSLNVLMNLILLINQSLTCSMLSQRKGDVKAVAGLDASLVIASMSLLVMNAISSLTVLSSIP